MTTYYFVRPTDSLFVRGNLAFGDAGEHGAGVMPPPPSLFAGAFRSALLGRDPQALAQFTQAGRCDDPAIGAALGMLDKDGRVERTGAFRITWLSLAGIPSPIGLGHAVVPEPLLPLPADLVCLELGFAVLTPGEADPLVVDSRDLPRVAVLRAAKQEKPEGGVFLKRSGWEKHLAGALPDKMADSVKAADVYARDPRLGIGSTPMRAASSRASSTPPRAMPSARTPGPTPQRVSSSASRGVMACFRALASCASGVTGAARSTNGSRLTSHSFRRSTPSRRRVVSGSSSPRRDCSRQAGCPAAFTEKEIATCFASPSARHASPAPLSDGVRW